MTESKERPRILVADDHTFFVEGFTLLLEPEFELVGTARDGDELMALAPRLRPDVIVIDISMPKVDGIEACRRLRASMPEVKILFLTQHDEPEYVTQALRAGASGYILKSSATAEIFEAIPKVLQGGVYVTPPLADVAAEDVAGDAGPRKPADLTPRQRQVLKLLADGRSMKEIAAALHVTPRTVAFHKYRMMEQLGIRTTAKLVQYAVKQGIVGA